MARYYSEPDELVDCHKCGDGKDTLKMEDDNHISIICKFCLGHKKVYFTHRPYYRYARAQHPYPNEYKVREIHIYNQKMTIETTISHDVEFHEGKGLSKKEALDKIQKEFNNEKRELLELEDRILYRDIIKERLRAHEVELEHGSQASFKDMIMSKERKNYSAKESLFQSVFSPVTKVSKCDVCNGTGTCLDEEDELYVCYDCIGTGYVDDAGKAISIINEEKI